MNLKDAEATWRPVVPFNIDVLDCGQKRRRDPHSSKFTLPQQMSCVKEMGGKGSRREYESGRKKERYLGARVSQGGFTTVG